MFLRWQGGFHGDMPAVGIGEHHLQRGPALFLERMHDRTTVWRSKLVGVVDSKAKGDLKSMTGWGARR
jgi:hypothetical protein